MSTTRNATTPVCWKSGARGSQERGNAWKRAEVRLLFHIAACPAAGHVSGERRHQGKPEPPTHALQGGSEIQAGGLFIPHAADNPQEEEQQHQHEAGKRENLHRPLPDVRFADIQEYKRIGPPRQGRQHRHRYALREHDPYQSTGGIKVLAYPGKHRGYDEYDPRPHGHDAPAYCLL